MSQTNDPEELDGFNVEYEDDIKVLPSDYREAVIWSTDWTTETIVSQIKKSTIDLKPKWQRREAWDDKRKSKFIESIILGMPIPAILLAERKEKKGTYIVIDGKQRLLSMRRFFSEKNDPDFKPLKLKGLESIPSLNGKSFYDFNRFPDLEDYISQIENQPIRTVVIKNWPNENFLYDLFLRLNTGSLPLAPQELRQALHPGPFIDFADEFSVESSQVRRVLNIQKPDYRMRDVELVIRYLAFKTGIGQYTGNLKIFFDDTVERLNSTWENAQEAVQNTSEELNHAIDFTYEIFGKDAFRKWKNGEYQGRLNKAVFDIMVFFLSDQKLRKALNNKYDEIKDRFKHLCETDVEFLNSLETSTKNVEPTKKRYNSWGKVLSEISGINIPVPMP